MSESDHTATQALRIATRKWLSAVITPKMVIGAIVGLIGAGGAVSTFLWGNHQLSGKVDTLTDQVTALTAAVNELKNHDTSLAVMQQHMQDVDRRLDEHQERWERIDHNIDLGPDPRRRNRKPFP